MSTATVTRFWFTCTQAAEYVGMHVDTIRKAAAKGELHGTQRTAPNGHWRIHRDCLDAWMAGQKCTHQEEA